MVSWKWYPCNFSGVLAAVCSGADYSGVLAVVSFGKQWIHWSGVISAQTHLDR